MPTQPPTPTQTASEAPLPLLSELRAVLSSPKHAPGVPASPSRLLALRWRVGERLLAALGPLKIEDSTLLVSVLGRALTGEFGPDFGAEALRQMIRFTWAYSDPCALAPLLQTLGWTQFQRLSTLHSDEKRGFYTSLCASERCTKRQLEQRIAQSRFERSISGASHSGVTSSESSEGCPFASHYCFEFLALEPNFSESRLEEAILQNIPLFLRELGAGFTFQDRQKRMPHDGQTRFLDLLLYHKPLRAHVAVELKAAPLKPGGLGQAALYLQWLDRFERHPSDALSLGLLLCPPPLPPWVPLLSPSFPRLHVATYSVSMNQRLRSMRGANSLTAQQAPSETNAL